MKKIRVSTFHATTVEPDDLKDHPVGHTNVVFQGRWWFTTGSITLIYRAFCQEYLVLSGQVFSRGSGLSRQVSLYYSWSKLWCGLTCDTAKYWNTADGKQSVSWVGLYSDVVVKWGSSIIIYCYTCTRVYMYIGLSYISQKISKSVSPVASAMVGQTQQASLLHVCTC